MTTNAGRVVGDFVIQREIGRGSQGTTYEAVAADGQRVAIKELSFATMAGWKSLELFERETATLRGIRHESIPRFIGAVRDDDAAYLVQEFVEGEPMSRIVQSGTLSADELQRLATDVLDVLVYLHELQPPVVHRDIKPANIIRKPTGAHVLVDFGGVQAVTPDDIGGSTVIGTTGYMPSEQLIGRASARSDLYSLGATLVHLSTGKHPAELPTKRLKIQWRDQTSVSPRMTLLIDQLLEPAPEDRPASARDARELLLTGATKSRNEAASTALAPIRESNEIVAAIPRPSGLCPERVRKRFSVRRHTLKVNFGVLLKPRTKWAIAGVFFAGPPLGCLFGSIVPLLPAGIAVILFFYFLTGGVGRESLRFKPNGDFEWRYGAMTVGEVRHARPRRIVHEGKVVYLVPESGPRIDLSGWLDDAERPWVAWILDRYLTDGVVPAEIEVER